ncbi:mRNA surveillance protein pelota [Candidatus Woesearchaeota archaeon CG10_big_fil_rev_8_21_14_0_10_37_12]|nr:MAG: mRNA surveillance protein pelota [Candidatus Woesearchaeota archaeon CG10_big_fil_rev_8_21_14_0_10_37_12]
MRIIKKDLRNNKVVLRIETPEDLWYLSQLIEKNDLLTGKTTRKIKLAEDVSKKTITLTIKTEKTEYTETNLRVNGTVQTEIEDIPKGSYHTISIEASNTITLQKEHWHSYQLKQLEEAATQQAANILICAFDREEAYFARMKRSGIENLSKLTGDVQRKHLETKTTKNFYAEIIKQIEEYDKRYNADKIIIASPAFWKEELFKILTNEQLKKKIIQATCSAANERAIDEVIKRDEVKSALKQERTTEEIQSVEQLMQHIAKNSLAVYGFTNTEKAAQIGAIITLLVTDTLIHDLREKQTFDTLNEIMKLVEQNKGSVIIISSKHEGGKTLNGLGGIGAILRYKII